MPRPAVFTRPTTGRHSPAMPVGSLEPWPTRSADFYAVIPAGGIGSRLWPLSRADAPKFLHDLTGSGQTLLRDTWDRLEPLAGADRIAVVTGRAHRAAVERELPGVPDKNVFLESEPRDSAAAIGLAAAILARREPDVIIGSFAADHVIRGTQVFDWAVRQAVATAREGYICTIGIPPVEPSVGFGYIKKGGEIVVDGAPEAALVERFVEKPDLETAKAYYADRSYLWNAGMFISRADVLLAELALEPARAARRPSRARRGVGRPRRTRSRRRPGVADPHEDRDRLRRGRARGRERPARRHPGALRLGRRRGLREPREAQRAAATSSRSSARTRGSSPTRRAASSSRQTKRVISIIGVKDIVVVDTEDALLVTTSEHAQRVKAIVDALKLNGQGDVL